MLPRLVAARPRTRRIGRQSHALSPSPLRSHRRVEQPPTWHSAIMHALLPDGRVVVQSEAPGGRLFAPFRVEVDGDRPEPESESESDGAAGGRASKTRSWRPWTSTAKRPLDPSDAELKCECDCSRHNHRVCVWHVSPRRRPCGSLLAGEVSVIPIEPRRQPRTPISLRGRTSLDRRVFPSTHDDGC